MSKPEKINTKTAYGGLFINVILFVILIVTIKIWDNNELEKTKKEFLSEKAIITKEIINWRNKYEKLEAETNNIIKAYKDNVCSYQSFIFTKRDLIYKWAIKNAKPHISEDIIKTVVDEALKYENPILILAIIVTESHFDIFDISSKKAYGLMQIKWNIWKKELKNKLNIISIRDLCKIENNIKAGHYIFMKYYKESNSLYKALNKYVGGDSNYVYKVVLKYAELENYILTGK